VCFGERERRWEDIEEIKMTNVIWEHFRICISNF
jgi:hypothetical protein